MQTRGGTAPRDRDGGHSMTIASWVRMAALGALLIGAPGLGWAQAPAGGGDDGTIVYRPPMRGAPQVRTGGASRGAAATELVLEALAPEQVGLTAVAQPTLYYFISGPADADLQFTLSPQVGVKPM